MGREVGAAARKLVESSSPLYVTRVNVKAVNSGPGVALDLVGREVGAAAPKLIKAVAAV